MSFASLTIFLKSDQNFRIAFEKHYYFMYKIVIIIFFNLFHQQLEGYNDTLLHFILHLITVPFII